MNTDNFRKAFIQIMVVNTVIMLALGIAVARFSVIANRQSTTIKDLTTVCERLSQVFVEAEEGTETAIEQEQQPEGITDL